MADARTQPTLEARLRDLGTRIDRPLPDPTLPDRVTARIVAQGTRRRWWSLPPRPARRSLVLALVLLLALAAVATAVGLGLRGLRIIIVSEGEPTPTVSRRPLPLGLGSPIAMDGLAEALGFEPLFPDDLPPPDEAFVANGRLSLVWRPSDDLPAVDGTDVGLVMTEFRGAVDGGYYEKLIQTELADVERVFVDGEPGFWISGQVHALVYRDPSGEYVEETRRVVADVLLWEVGALTLRMESALGRDATIALAEGVVPQG